MSFIYKYGFNFTALHVSEKCICILHVNMVLFVRCYIVSEIVATGGFILSVYTIICDVLYV